MISFYFFGDMGDGSKNQYRVSKAIKEQMDNKKEKDIFIVGLGDNIYENGCIDCYDSQFKTKFENPYRNISDSIKFYMCLGNHDYGIKELEDKGNSQSQIDYSKLSKKRDGKWILPSNYYNYKKGNISFFVIDTNLYNLTPEEVRVQLEIMKNKINKSTSKWKIVYGHHTWRSMGHHGTADENLENFLSELFNTTNADAYMCGHDHSKQVIRKKMNNREITLIVCGTGGNDCDITQSYDVGNDSKLLFGSTNHGYGYCIPSKDELKMEFYDSLNDLEYVHIIKK